MNGIELIESERKRQIDVLGFDAHHDRHHTPDELATAGAIYALPEKYRQGYLLTKWPWEMEWYKPCPDNRIRELVKAGALIAAEIDYQLSLKEFDECNREILFNATAERAKSGATTIIECQEAVRRLDEAKKDLECQKRLIAENQPEPSDDVLTEEKVNDYYQERSVKAGERADHLAWMFILMMTGVLISGHSFQAFAVCAAFAAVYMLLSVAQAVWQTFTSWLFKQQIKKMDVAPDDYPEWVGGGAWLFFWAKMITIASAVIYFANAIFF